VTRYRVTFRDLPGGDTDAPPGRRLARAVKFAERRAGLRCLRVEELTEEIALATDRDGDLFWIVLEEGVDPVRWTRPAVASWMRTNRLAPRAVQLCPDGGREWGTADAFGFTCPPPPPPPKALAVAQAAPEAPQAPAGQVEADDASTGLPDGFLPVRLEYGRDGELLREEVYGRPEEKPAGPAEGNGHAAAPEWRVDQGDALEWLATLPEGGADLILFSPPYERARLYLEDGKDLGIARDTETWVAWMVKAFTACRRACKGLVAAVVEGQTRDYRYSAGPLLLGADLHRAGFHLRKPPIYMRYGVSGSGGPDWLKNNYEFVICATRGGKLPWSDNTACGHPPKYKPGGAMSNRTADGRRVNAKTGAPRKPNGRRDRQGYNPPKLANPGNVIDCAAGEEAGLVVNCGAVGVGRMGSGLAHDNEAPFPEKLAEFFVRSFCPPGGLVIDPMCGSGTTGAVAVRLGRRFLGCDLRQSQVDLSRSRLGAGEL
jgi:hypothetical protein